MKPCRKTSLTLRCTISLPNSEWYLVTAMLYGQLDEAVSNMGSTWTGFVLGGCAHIIVTLGAIFIYYFRLTWRQMTAIDEACKTAEKSLSSQHLLGFINDVLDMSKLKAAR